MVYGADGEPDVRETVPRLGRTQGMAYAGSAPGADQGCKLMGMGETPEELAELDRLLSASLGGAGDHLRSIMTEEERTLNAAETCRVLTGMKTLALATVTSAGEPRISGVDGHFLHARWVFTTAGTAVKARHLRARPSASVAHIVGDDLGVYAHGTVEFLTDADADFAAIDAHLVKHYGSSPSSWGDDIVYLRLQPSWMVSYAFNRAALLRSLDGDDAEGTVSQPAP